MSTSTVGPTPDPGAAFDSSQTSLPAIGSSPGASASKSNPPASVTAGADQEVARMRRRLFRTLEQPEQPIVAIDCGSVSMSELRSTTEQFLEEEGLRENFNLVLAVPTDVEFANSAAFDWIQSIKQTAFDEGFEGKVSWLLVHDPSVELRALKDLTSRQGGKWLASV